MPRPAVQGERLSSAGLGLTAGYLARRLVIRLKVVLILLMQKAPLKPTTTSAPTLNRRTALRRLGTGALLAAGLWPGAQSLRAGTGEGRRFRFVAVNDLHCMSAQCGAWLELVVAQIRRERPELVLLCGDLTEYGQAKDFAMVRDVFATLKVPFWAQIGNHDYLTDTDRRAYESAFPRQVNYAFDHRGWQFVGLDTTQGQSYQKTSIQPATLQWLEESLPKLDRRKPTVVFTHFPMGENVRYRPANASLVWERLKPFNVKAILAGHWHGYTYRWQEDCFAVTNRCCALRRDNHDGSAQRGFLVCDVADGAVTHRFVEVRVPDSLAAFRGKATPKPASVS